LEKVSAPLHCNRVSDLFFRRHLLGKANSIIV